MQQLAGSTMQQQLQSQTQATGAPAQLPSASSSSQPQPSVAATATAPTQPQGPVIKLIDLRPSANSVVNTTFILLEKWQPSRVSDGGATVCVALVADATAAVHLQLWGQECDAFQPSDIIRLTNGVFSSQKNNMVLRTGKKGGALEKIGQFIMVFVENPNMSRVQWVPDPSNSKLLVPAGIGGTGPSSSAPGPNFRGYH